MKTKAEQIEEITNEILLIPDAPEHEARLSAKALYSAGYRKVEKPPVLTDIHGKLAQVIRDAGHEPLSLATWILTLLRTIAQAQRDADWKAIWGEE